MSVLLETSLGEIVVDLLVENAPKLCEKYVSILHIIPIKLVHFLVYLWVTSNYGSTQLLEIMQDQILQFFASS